MKSSTLLRSIIWPDPFKEQRMRWNISHNRIAAVQSSCMSWTVTQKVSVTPISCFNSLHALIQKTKTKKKLKKKTRFLLQAMVITQLMNKLQISSSLIVSIVLYGNPYFKGGASQNACSAVSFWKKKKKTWPLSCLFQWMPSLLEIRIWDCCRNGNANAITIHFDCVWLLRIWWYDLSNHRIYSFSSILRWITKRERCDLVYYHQTT